MKMNTNNAYQAPNIKIKVLDTHSALLEESGVFGAGDASDIGWGGVDTGGTEDPQSKDFSPSKNLWED